LMKFMKLLWEIKIGRSNNDERKNKKVVKGRRH